MSKHLPISIIRRKLIGEEKVRVLNLWTNHNDLGGMQIIEIWEVTRRLESVNGFDISERTYEVEVEFL